MCEGECVRGNVEILTNSIPTVMIDTCSDLPESGQQFVSLVVLATVLLLPPSLDTPSSLIG